MDRGEVKGVRPPSSPQDDNASVRMNTGVKRIEAFARATRGKKGHAILAAIAVSIYLCNWVYSMQESTTYAYSVWATGSFQSHSTGLATLNIATSVISSVSVPFLGKFSDVFGRPYIYVIALVFYVVGFVIIAFAPTLAAYVLGSVFVAVGGAAIGLLNAVLTADLVPLQWRGAAQGLLSTPYLATVWYTSKIAEQLGTAQNWRWGFGMYAIIMPCVMGPALIMIIWGERKARKLGYAQESQPDATARSSGEDMKENDETDLEGKDQPSEQALHHLTRADPPSESQQPWTRKAINVFHELDAFGLILLGFGWTLLLLPFSLQAGADNGYKNPSLIAMFVVGSLCLVAYCGYEAVWAKYPTAPIRLLKNRTFITAIIIDFIYMVAGYMNLTYLNSYVYVVTDIETRQWNYYNNILTMFLCSFGFIGGMIQRYTHRYKALQLCGLCIKLIGYALLVDKAGVRSYARLVMAQVLTGIGGAFSVIGTQVASQASVPHQDVALVISLLTLWTAIGASIGSAIAVSMWDATMPGNLRQYIPVSAANDTMIETFFGDITQIKLYDLGTEIREGAITAYGKTVYPMWAAALGLSFISVIAGCFQTNYYLGNQQNAYDNKDVTGAPTDAPDGRVEPKTKMQKILRFWDF